MSRARTIANFGDGIATADIDDGAVTAGKLNSTLDLTGKTVTLPAGVGGKVLQVLQATKTNNQTIATSTPTALSGLSVAITPTSASSKFLLSVSIVVQSNATNGGTTVWFYRDSTKLGWGGDYTVYPMDSGEEVIWSDSILDAPATASAITYSCFAATPSAVSMSFNPHGGHARLTVMEIAG